MYAPTHRAASCHRHQLLQQRERLQLGHLLEEEQEARLGRDFRVKIEATKVPTTTSAAHVDQRIRWGGRMMVMLVALHRPHPAVNVDFSRQRATHSTGERLEVTLERNNVTTRDFRHESNAGNLAIRQRAEFFSKSVKQSPPGHKWCR